ncbi:TetR/AcrR family transcriptional regulator [Leucobacter iarius]|uniref:HTH tetR-type domain-containing protein n=1 Tax=Leucobacter iarius TaxID=333963 RepID=A0ABN2L8A7_9MICO
MRTADREDESVSTTPRRRETRARLLAAAFEVFAEVGLGSASVEQICQRAGFTRGAFYSNFSTKEELFLELLSQELRKRLESLEAAAERSMPELRQRSCTLDRDDLAAFVTEFFADFLQTGEEATTWYVLETEFLLLALRDPELAPRHVQFSVEVCAEMAPVIERLVGAAGRRFVLPIERALGILTDFFERAMRASALQGPDAPDGLTGFGRHTADLLFAITEPATAADGSDAEQPPN